MSTSFRYLKGSHIRACVDIFIIAQVVIELITTVNLKFEGSMEHIRNWASSKSHKMA